MTVENNAAAATGLEGHVRRGRPPKDRTENHSIEREPAGRAKRVPLGVQQAKLSADIRTGYVGRWVNDDKNRIQAALGAGYEFVMRDAVANSTDPGNRISQIVGTKEGGHPLTAYLMEIPEEWYREDQQAKAQQVDDTEGLIRRGELTQKVGSDGSYIPSQGISIKRAR